MTLRSSAAREIVHVAAAQMLVGGDPRTNLRRILTVLDTAARNRSDVVCFPEVCLVNDYEDATDVGAYLDEIRASLGRDKSGDQAAG